MTAATLTLLAPDRLRHLALPIIGLTACAALLVLTLANRDGRVPIEDQLRHGSRPGGAARPQDHSATAERDVAVVAVTITTAIVLRLIGTIHDLRAESHSDSYRVVH